MRCNSSRASCADDGLTSRKLDGLYLLGKMDWDEGEPVELSPKSLQKADQHRGAMGEKGHSCRSDLDESEGEYQDEAFLDGETALDEHNKCKKYS